MGTLIVISVCLGLLLAMQLYLLRRNEESLQREARAQSDRAELVEFINRYTASIGSSRDTGEWMKLVAGLVATAIEAQAVWIYWLEDENSARLLAFSGAFPEFRPGGDAASSQSRRLLEQLSPDKSRLEAGHGSGLVGQIIGPASVLKEDFNAQYGAGPVKTLVSTPLEIDNERNGLICAINRSGATPHFSVDDMFLLEALARQVALGITFIQAYERLGEQQRVDQELMLAQRIQNSLLPQDPPLHDVYLIHADCMAARTVSGDFYDFIQISDDLLLVLVADASGKGIPACMLMALCRSILRTNTLRYQEDLEGLMHESNRNLYEDTDSGQFVTVACLLIDKHDHTVEYARAGHCALLIRSPDGNVEVILPDGPALGLLPEEIGIQYDTFAFSWQPGVSLMLFTDGITEAADQDGEIFGLHRLIDTWKTQELDPAVATGGILGRVKDFTGNHPQEDDQTLMILHRPPRH